ncbi:hypothetical protein [Streptomyces sp. SBT349]|uniref:hypothetical protein n=1 Tax=Streptomyces sp. SBT349 TaxID=1580539 RepID=UPI00066B178C|nr:hypothetical protein [Streptomyces sp. SBT349]
MAFALGGPVIYQGTLGETTAARVVATHKEDGPRDFGTQYDLVDASTGEDLGRMATGPHEAVPVGATVEVATDPFGFARPAATERLDLAPVWSTLAALGLATTLVTLVTTARHESAA